MLHHRISAANFAVWEGSTLRDKHISNFNFLTELLTEGGVNPAQVDLTPVLSNGLSISPDRKLLFKFAGDTIAAHRAGKAIDGGLLSQERKDSLYENLSKIQSTATVGIQRSITRCEQNLQQYVSSIQTIMRDLQQYRLRYEAAVLGGKQESVKIIESLEAWLKTAGLGFSWGTEETLVTVWQNRATVLRDPDMTDMSLDLGIIGVRAYFKAISGGHILDVKPVAIDTRAKWLKDALTTPSMPVCHPHTFSNGDPCWGAFESDIRGALGCFDIVMALHHGLDALSTYNPNSVAWKSLPRIVEFLKANGGTPPEAGEIVLDDPDPCSDSCDCSEECPNCGACPNCSDGEDMCEVCRGEI